jgi:hypothetical protein
VALLLFGHIEVFGYAVHFPLDAVHLVVDAGARVQASGFYALPGPADTRHSLGFPVPG